MKKFKNITIATLSLLCCFFAINLQAQNWDCDCPEVEEGEYVCVTDSSGITFAFPSECLAECFGLTISTEECEPFEGDWDNGGNNENDPWTDCDCEDDWTDEGVCFEYVLETGDTIVEWAPSECWAECLGFEDITIVECNWDNPWEDCDCEETEGEEYICILTDATTGTICVFPNLCFAECSGYTAADQVDCSEFNVFLCEECEEEEYSPVCVVDSSGFTFELPNQCYADCFGYAISEEDCTNGWEDPCDCEEEENEEGICVEVVYGDETSVEWVPSICLLECFGITEYTIVDCDSLWVDPWTDCECTEEYAPVCVVDQDGNVFEAYNECYAACYGFELTDEDCSNGWEDPCDCSEEPEGEGLCIEVTYGDGDTYVEWFPNECYIACVYDTNYTVVDCDFGDWEGGDYEGDLTALDSCLINIDFEQYTLLQEVILALGDCGMELTECVLDAPLFATDEEFLDYIYANCDDIFEGFEGNNGLGNLMSRMNESNGGNNNPTSTEDVLTANYQIQLFGNPVSDQLQYNIKSTTNGNANVRITDAFGKAIHTATLNVQTGDNNNTLDVSTFNNQLYFLSVSINNKITTTKFVVTK